MNSQLEKKEKGSSHVNEAILKTNFWKVRAHWTKTLQSGANCHTSEAHLRNRRINDSPLAELVHESLCNLEEVRGQQRFRLNYFQQQTLYAPLYCATSSPRTNTLSSRIISSSMAALRASRTVIYVDSGKNVGFSINYDATYGVLAF